jgi:hypothetical protein
MKTMHLLILAALLGCASNREDARSESNSATQENRIASLIEILQGDKDGDRNNAQSELIKIGSPAVMPLINAMDTPARPYAINVLGAIKDERALDKLIALLRSEGPHLTKIIIPALQSITSLDFGMDKEKWISWYTSTYGNKKNG